MLLSASKSEQSITYGLSSIAGVYEHIRNPAPDPTSEFSRSPTKFVSSKDNDANNNSLFGNFNLGNATAFVGQTAHLHCAVENLGDRTVSLLGQPDLSTRVDGSDLSNP